MGYSINRSHFYQGRQEQHYLETILSRVGATSQEHDLFLHLAVNTFTFEDEGNTLYYADTRAAQSIIFAFPFNVQVFLTLIFYNYDVRNLEYLRTILLREVEVNQKTPVEVLRLNAQISRVPITTRLTRVLDSDLPILQDSFLGELKFILGLSDPIDLDTPFTVEDKLNTLFDIFRVNASYKQFYIDIVKTNDRVKAASLIAQLLNYKKSSVQELAQYFEQWQSSRSI